MPNNGHHTIDLINITKIPRSYLTRGEHKKSPENPDGNQDVTHTRYENFLSAMMYSDLSIGFRIQSIQGQVNLHYLTNANKSNVLTSAFYSQFLGFELQHQEEYISLHIEQPIYVAVIRGIPKPTGNALDGLVESMINSKSSSLYQVWASPTKPGFVSRKAIEKKYSSALGRAQIQDSSESWLRGKETITRYDVDAIRTSKGLKQPISE
ncbi:MAG: hypothetical protein E4H14_10000 [Candidatus Thorarchaeota archaeon]|nr:MAG: hypothetical protein E4H14_10000 [Candidatus Thorarchaeota archaeon]